MYLGHFVEVGERREIFLRPKHPYTEALFSGIPQPNPHRPLERIILEGDIPEVANVPSGCPFHTRCPYRQPICEQELPPLAPVGWQRAPVRLPLRRRAAPEGRARTARRGVVADSAGGTSA